MEVDNDNIRYNKAIMQQKKYQFSWTLQTHWTDFTKFNKKLKRDTVSSEEMLIISKVVNVEYKHEFAIQDGKKVGVVNIL